MRTIASIFLFSSRRAARRARSSHGVPSSNLAVFVELGKCDKSANWATSQSVICRSIDTFVADRVSFREEMSPNRGICRISPVWAGKAPRPCAAVRAPAACAPGRAYASRQALRLCPFAASLVSLPLPYARLPSFSHSFPRRPVLGSSSPFASSCRFVDVSCRQITCSRCGLCGASPIMQHLIFD